MVSKKQNEGQQRARKRKGSAGKRTRKGETANRTARGTGANLMGVRVPKTLANALDTLVNSPRGREILASAVMAAASAAAAALAKSSNRTELKKSQQAAAEAGEHLTHDLSEAAASVVAGIVTEAARSFLPKSLTRENKKED